MDRKHDNQKGKNGENIMKAIFIGFLCYVVCLQSTVVQSADKVVVVPLMKTNVFSVARTGQTTCYKDDGTQVNCAGTGQDGELQKGYGWTGPRFTDMGDGVVRDNLTGLMWLKNANCIRSEIPEFDQDDTNFADDPPAYDEICDGKVSRAHAFDFVNGLNKGGIFVNSVDQTLFTTCGGAVKYSDWRLPNRNELLSLMDISQIDPPLSIGHPFENVEFDYYWSSSYSVYGANLGVGWVVDFSHGTLHRRSWSYQSALVWPVRGGR